MSTNELSKKKILGQYFSGTKLATLLAHLANYNKAESAIDPMCGNGDMLAVIHDGKSMKHTVGIEVDNEAYTKASSRFSNFLKNSKPEIYLSSAFNSKNIKKLSRKKYDLVITNPPYVRYQTISTDQAQILGIQSSNEIRNELLKIIQIDSMLNKSDQKHFTQIVKTYSGLSDLAVPAWILSAMLTKVGGYLAIVVPETWLTREYAQIIQYMLLRWFNIEFVIKDEDVSWFPGIQVKTNLIVARRVERKKSFLSDVETYYKIIGLKKSAGSLNSLVSKIYPSKNNTESLFVNQIKKNKPFTSSHVSVQTVSTQILASNLYNRIRSKKWLSLLETNIKNEKNPIKNTLVTPLLHKWCEGKLPNCTTLDEIGYQVGQGLRTGCNRFFYVDSHTKTSNGEIVILNKIFGFEKIDVLSENLKLVLRKQSEIKDTYIVREKDISGRVLDLRRHALPIDSVSTTEGELPKKWYYEVSDSLARHLNRAANFNIGEVDNPKYIPELSSVRTNQKKWNSRNPLDPPKFWYMLPDFMPRHSPELFIGRINGKCPRTILNKDKVLIDANFSTIWRTSNQPSYDVYTLLAILNSTWSKLAMEESGTVMGGGALKLEATHIKNIPILKVDKNTIDELNKLGKKLIKNKKSTLILNNIDHCITRYILGRSQQKKVLELQSLLENQLSKRIKNHGT